jgi:hypothetical protein
MVLDEPAPFRQPVITTTLSPVLRKGNFQVCPEAFTALNFSFLDSDPLVPGIALMCGAEMEK